MVQFTKKGIRFEIPSRQPAEDYILLQSSMLTVLQMAVPDRSDLPMNDEQSSAYMDVLAFMRSILPAEEQMSYLHRLEQEAKQQEKG